MTDSLVGKGDAISSVDPKLFVKSINLSSLQDAGGARYIAGYANVADIVDSQNDKISLDVLSRAWEKWSKNPDFCILSLEHSNIPIARVEFDEVVDSLGNKFKSGMDKIGLFIVAKIRDDIAIANDVWGVISSGAKKGFSIAGEHLTPPKKECTGGTCYKVPQDIELHEIGIVGHPANQASLFSVLKGDDSLFNLAEAVSKIKDKGVLRDAIKVSKRKYDDGKYGVYVSPEADVLIKGVKFGDEFKFVKEMCPKNEWITLFDVSLSRPSVVKTADDRNVGSNLSSTMNKPTPEVGNISQDNKAVKSEAESPITLDKLYAMVCKLCDKVGLPMDEEKKLEVVADVVQTIELSKSTTPAPETKPVATTTTPPPEPKVEVVVQAPPVAPVAPAPVVEAPKPAPIPTPVAPIQVQEPVVEKPVVISPPVAPPAEQAGKGAVTEAVVIQRGKVAPSISTGFDLARLNKLSWRDISRLRGDDR